MSVAIAANKLTKRYDTITALSEISFEVQVGEIMGFLGPNGAGKTTTLRILSGMIAPTQGSVHIDGIDVVEHSLEVRRKIGYLPEHVALYPEMRVLEYLNYRSRIKGISPREQTHCVQASLEQCALTDVSRQLIGRLSKGYRQRVALADCLLNRPRILILDEPTVGLDPHQIRQTRELITTLGRTTTILLSTHILPEVEMICQRVTIIDKGRIVAVDSPAGLRARRSGFQVVHIQLRGAESPAMEGVLKQLPQVIRVSLLGQADGVSSFEIEAQASAEITEAIFHLAVKNQWVIRELSQQRATLEDIFVQLTTHES